MSYDPNYPTFSTTYIIENPDTEKSIEMDIEAHLIMTGPDEEVGYSGEQGVEDASLNQAIVLENGIVIERDSDLDDAFKILFENGYTNGFTTDWEDIWVDFSDETVENYKEYLQDTLEPNDCF